MKRRWFLAAASLMLLIPQLLFAQDSTIEFYGTIQSANATAIVINGQIVDTQSAQINTPLTVGTIVHVQASSAADGSFTATEIDPVAPETIPGIVEIDGLVTESGTSTITIGTQTIDVSNAEVNGTISQGDPIRVFAISTAPGKWSALLIVPKTIPAPVATAEVIPPAATPDVLPPVATPDVIAPVSTPEVAAPVSTPDVIAPVSTPEVNAPVTTPEVGGDFKISGVVQSVTDADLVVNGQRFFIGGARIDGRLAVGAQVQLEIRVVNGQWVLEEIKVATSGSNNGSDDHGGGNSGGSNSGGDGTGGSSGGSNSGSNGSGDNGSGSNSGSNGSGGSQGGKGSGDGSQGGGNSGSGSSGSSDNSGSGHSGKGG